MKRSVELFSGTGSFSQVALERGYQVATYDNCPNALPLGQHRRLDLLHEGVRFPQEPGVLWASPPCQSFSVAAIGGNYRAEGDARIPKSESAFLGLRLLLRTVAIIAQTQPRLWFIENPRGMMRRKMDAALSLYGLHDYVRHTIGYCSYGDTRQKPTDIWTNCHAWASRPLCAPGSDCHEAAPRGSKTGTQGVKGARDRSRIPAELFREIFDAIEK